MTYLAIDPSDENFGKESSLVRLDDFSSWCNAQGIEISPFPSGAELDENEQVSNGEHADFDIDPADLPEELSAANIAFRAVMNGYGEPQATFKNRLIRFLQENFPSLGAEAVQRIATVANPDKQRGRKNPFK